MRMIVTGGGTGGHIYPAMAVAKGLLEHRNDVEVLYVGTIDGMEANLVPDSGLSFKGISGKGLPRKLSKETLKTVGLNLKALWEMKRVLKEFKPDLVLGTGGYVSGPVVFISAFFGIPTLLHEQNAYPGKTNRLLARWAKKVMVSFPESEKYFSAKEKVVVVGIPVREEIGTITRKAGAQEMGLDPEKRTLLVTGGSRGALSINKAFIQVLKKLEAHPDIQVIWSTGQATYEDIVSELKNLHINWERKGWLIAPYLKNMPEAMACADLCICRAGATTLAELSAAGKASILIPYPFAAENHQEYNAKAFADKGASQMILDKELDGDRLWQEIEKILLNSFKLEEMARKSKEMFAPGALDRIMQICMQTAWK